MNPLRKILMLVVGAMFAFIVAALFHYGSVWGAGVVVPLCALSLLTSMSLMQTARNLSVLAGWLNFGFAIVGCGIFALLFLGGLFAILYMVACVACNIWALASKI